LIGFGDTGDSRFPQKNRFRAFVGMPKKRTDCKLGHDPRLEIGLSIVIYYLQNDRQTKKASARTVGVDFAGPRTDSVGKGESV
jgi:hypothetical protein